MIAGRKQIPDRKIKSDLQIQSKGYLLYQMLNCNYRYNLFAR